MAVQAERDISNVGFIKNNDSLTKSGTIAQDESRTEDLLQNTVMAQIAATGFWTPFNSVAGTDGSAIPRGIYLGEDIDEADLVAGNITDVPILVGDAYVDRQLVVWDQDTLDEDSVIGAATIHAVAAEEALSASSNIFIEDTENITNYEN